MKKLINLIIALIMAIIIPIEVQAVELSSYQITCQEFKRCQEYLATHECHWKRILFVGDSITQGVQTGMSYPYHVNYPYMIGGLYHTNVSNYGIGGSTISYIGKDGGISPMCERICDYDLDYDCVFVMGGINDWFYGYLSEIGDLNTPRTFMYDFDTLCRRIQNRYPNADVFIVIPLETVCHIGIEPYGDLEDYRTVERNFAMRYGFNIIDLPSENIMNPKHWKVAEDLFCDSCHPNSKGYNVLGMILAGRALMIKNGEPRWNKETISQNSQIY